MQGSTKKAGWRIHGANQEWGKKLRKEEAKTKRAPSKLEWLAEWRD